MSNLVIIHYGKNKGSFRAGQKNYLLTNGLILAMLRKNNNMLDLSKNQNQSMMPNSFIIYQEKIMVNSSRSKKSLATIIKFLMKMDSSLFQFHVVNFLKLILNNLKLNFNDQYVKQSIATCRARRTRFCSSSWTTTSRRPPCRRPGAHSAVQAHLCTHAKSVLSFSISL